MATPTLYEALDTYNDLYLDALSTNSKRKIEIYDQNWQQINNYWDLYTQASAEGNSTAAAEAINAIVTILGGGIDISTLPSVGGTTTEMDGSVSVSAVAQKITFAADLGVTNYRLLINIHDSNGIPIGYVLGAQESDGFNITPSFAGTLIYNAKVIS